MICTHKAEKTEEVSDLEVMINFQEAMSYQCDLVVKKVYEVLGCIGQGIFKRRGSITIPHTNPSKALVRLHVKYCSGYLCSKKIKF